MTKLATTPLSLMGTARKAPFALYIHWPFCLKKCPYCDFNSHVRDQVDHKRWEKALLAEISALGQLFPHLSLQSIFFGGGTPSLMAPSTIEAVIDKATQLWTPITQSIEITMEANPSSVEAAKFKAYRTAGVNRLSVGVQALNDADLKFLGRLHSAEEALKALEIARSTFDRVSIDLIYARPKQQVKDWEQELSRALSFDLSHLSLYQLTIEEGTAFYHQFARGKFTLPNDEEAYALYQATQALTYAAGLPAYEISNHARIGEESQHNLAYWQGDYYLGAGPGAHGRVPIDEQGAAQATAMIKRPEDWLLSVEKTSLGLQSTEMVPTADRAVEAIMMGLRLTNGLNKDSFADKFGRLETYLDMQEVHKLIQSGYVVDTEHTLKLSETGIPVLNFLLPKLLA